MGKEQLSITKISRPLIKGIYHRKRLYNVIDRHLHSPVIWVSGPAGSGKTTLVSSYIEQKKAPCLWYRMDKSDADPASFFHYMVLAGRKAAPHRKTPLPHLTPEYLPGIHVFTKRFFENLFYRLKPASIVVMDNYQDASGKTLFDTVMEKCLSVIPQGVTMFILSRTDPPAALARLRAGKNVYVIRWNALQLSLEETHGLIRNSGSGILPRKLVQKFHQKTNGWIAGVVLLLEKAETEGIELLLESINTPREIFDYFAEEIFYKTDEDIRGFLIRTALLPDIFPQIAEEITAIKHTGKILSDLYVSNFFTERRLSPSGPVYHYHPLFREFLLSKARDYLAAGEINDLLKKAGKLFEKNDHTEGAMELYVTAGDFENLVPLVIDNAQTMVIQGRHLTLERWLRRLPEKTLESNPWLLYWMGVCRMPYDTAEALGFSKKAYELFRSKKDTAGVLLSWSGVVETYLHGLTFKPLDYWIAEIEKLFKNGLCFPSPEIEFRVTGSVFSALLYKEPWHEKISKWAERLKILAGNCPDLRTSVMINSQLATYYSWKGERESFTGIVKNFEHLIKTAEIEPPFRLLWLNITAAHGWQMYLPGVCGRSVSEGLELIDKTGVHIWRVFLLGHGAAGCLSEGDMKKARQYLREMKVHMRTPVETANYYHYEAWYEAVEGNIDRAVEHLKICLLLLEETGFPFMKAFVTVDLAGLLIERGDSGKAGQLLKKAAASGDKIKSLEIKIKCLYAKTLLLLNLGKNDTALATLCKAFQLAVENDIVNFLFWRPSIMGRLCTIALEAGIENEFVRKLIRLRNLAPDLRTARPDNWPWAVKIYTLGKFTLEINGRPFTPSGKSQKKPLEMLKAVIAFGGKDINIEQLSDVLWPESHGDAAIMSFRTTQHRLRRLLGRDEAIKISGGRISLDEHYCWVDIWAYEQYAKEAESIWDHDRDRALSFIEKAVSIYRGHFLTDEDTVIWTSTLHERLRHMFFRQMELLGGYCEEKGDYEKAAGYYLRALETDRYAEEFYQRLMMCYKKSGKKMEALSVYTRCRETFSAVFGMEPSEETRKIIRDILK